MKKRWFLFYFPVLLASLMVVFEIEADAQGCAQRPSIVMHTHCDTGGYCTSQECVDGGRDTDYCSEGFGECCGSEITTANVVCDVDECCAGGEGSCATGCAPVRNKARLRSRLQHSNPVSLAHCSELTRLRRLGLTSTPDILIDDKLDFWNQLFTMRVDDRK